MGSCETGKVMYASAREAGIALRKVQRRRTGRTAERHAYPCDKCGHWHLSKSHRRTGQPRRMEPAKRWQWKGTDDEQ